ncbi:MAG: hypothetical protein HYV75_10015 [Opitutae bacterium]|nr:hypothetical protein [Opitutae bacterium]
MSLNRYEQSLFSYWDSQPDERRHWHGKVLEATRVASPPGETARALERELWDYFVERSTHVPHLRELSHGGLRRVSFLNLAEHIIRLWGPPPKPRKSPDPVP